MKKNSLFLVAMSLLLITTITLVNAEIELGTQFTAVTKYCCAKMSNGAICQEGINQVIVQEGVTCETGWLQTSCNEVSDCQKGCCIDNNQGLCSPSSPQGACKSGGGTWTNDLSCTTNQCQKNCCIIGENANYVTQRTCEVLSNARGQEMNYVPAPDENACLRMVGLQKKGACIYEREGERSCKFGTKEGCNSINGAFSENMLCSNPILNTTCKKQARTSCVEGLDEVYWMDDCGNGISNKENIWEGNSNSQKESSYNNGIIKAKQESCTVSSSNINTQCGNCDRNVGTKCSMNNQGSEASCISLNCINAPNTIGNQTRKNGESWCVYESVIGEGRDVPGSRHYKYSCVDGEVRSEGCGDFRVEICSEDQVLTQYGNYTKAICRPNLANECLNYNKIRRAKVREETCLNNSDCYIGSTSYIMTYGYGYYEYTSRNHYKICLPQYPIAYKKPTEEEQKKATKKNNPNICSRGNFKCSGKDCLDELAEMCISIGDCGPSSNILGNFTNSGYKITGIKAKITNKEIKKIKNYFIPTSNYKIITSEFVKNFLPAYYPSESQETHTISEVPTKAIINLLGIRNNLKPKLLCDYWQAPTGGRDCDKCDDNPLRECTKYRCESMGSTCRLINEGSADQMCTSISKDDNTVPIISPLPELLNLSYKYTNLSKMRVDLRTIDDNCLPENTIITIPIKTDEPAECTFNDEHTDSWSEENNYLSKDSSFVFNHSFSTTFPSADNIAYEILSSMNNTSTSDLESLERQINKQYNNFNYYVRCQDINGRVDIEEYIINTCIKPTDDTTPPAITKMIPEKGSYVAYDTKEFEAVFYTNEQAECRWSNNSGKNYNDMENIMDCQNGLDDMTPNGWACIANFTGMNNIDKNYFIKCQDKPWFKGTTKENERKANDNDFVYSVKATRTHLNITKIIPANNQIIYGGAGQFQLTISIDTTGGVEAGKAECKFTQIKDGYATPFRYTYSTNHKQFLTPPEGNYTYYFGCQDTVGNKAFAQSSFSLQLDTTSPIVTRTYVSGGTLNVITDEDSECAYSKTSCSFDFNNATRMLGINKVHTSSELSGEITYYIRCKDKFNNPATGCSIIAGLF